MIDARFAAGLAGATQRAGRERDDRDLRANRAGVGADGPCQGKAIHVRHVAVGDDQVERPRLPGLEGLATIGAGVHLQTQIMQALLQQVQVGGVIFSY